jgi:DNA-binding NarL/FixJ family response regulator
MIRILLVDDHRIVREGLASMLSTQADLCVVGEAATGREALASIQRLQPDIILLDLEMPDLDGVAVLEQMQPKFSSIHVIVLTAYGSEERILDAVRAGARGYLLKSAGLDEVLRAVRVVAEGGSLLEPMVTTRLLGSVERMLKGNRHGEEILTEREREILTLIARGFSNKAIGEELGLAERTVKFCATVIFRKLGVANRAEASAVALRDRLIQL